ncbi:MAG: hypothetical protein H6574_21590 [Lewinellaceae bacterium]|nr:hypothetical protein [Saprospiraceae bacterium]MCB9316778.1 hypothetical protein [Lewinellaceae bacterium]MCB9333658.1 hypothetical protein [Lewinellaceae bacterium]
MKKSILLILGIIVFISCDKNNADDNLINQLGEVCDFKTEIKSPDGFEVNSIGEIYFNGSVQAFQFLDDEIGYAMLSKNAGGYVEVFKTIDGGQTWSNLEIGINQYPRSILFKDENFGIITVLDVTGCPPPNCQNKCVILKTENGGISWEQVEFENLKGVLYHLKYDSNGNLYANLKLNDQSVLMKSVDNGANWDTLFSSSNLDFNLVTYSFEIFENKIYISAKDGEILVIDTNGQLIKTIDIGNSTIWDVEIIDENNLIVVLPEKVIKSINGGDTWETIYEESARMIGFDSVDKGLMLLKKSICPTDVYQVNDLIASTNNGGFNWIEAEETTTNLRINFTNSQQMGAGVWYMMIGNKLLEIKEN